MGRKDGNNYSTGRSEYQKTDEEVRAQGVPCSNFQARSDPDWQEFCTHCGYREGAHD